MEKGVSIFASGRLGEVTFKLVLEGLAGVHQEGRRRGLQGVSTLCAEDLCKPWWRSITECEVGGVPRTNKARTTMSTHQGNNR